MKPHLALVPALLLVGCTCGPTAGGPAAPPGAPGSPPPSGPGAPAPTPPPRQRTFTELKDVSVGVPAYWLEVAQPAAVHQALRANPWLKKTLEEPLGRGFAGGWAGFLGTRGEELAAAFSGEVLRVLLDELLASPYRVVWFAGNHPPAIVVSSPGAAATKAFQALVGVGGAGGFKDVTCGQGKEARTLGQVERITVAEKTLYGVVAQERLVLSPGADGVVSGACAALAPVQPRPGVAASVALSLHAGGRSGQALGQTLGVGDEVSLDFALEGASFTPRGLSAQVLRPGVLASSAPPPALLKAIPETAGVALFLTLRLPRVLSALSLRDTIAPAELTFEGQRQAWEAGPPRQVALVWNPRGRGAEDELAVVWARREDEEALQGLLAGGNGLLERVKGCAEVLAWATRPFAARVEQACQGKAVSVLKGPPGLVAGLQAPSSVGLVVQLGKVLSGLVLDGHESEAPARAGGKVPQEVEAARRLLEALPSLGFTTTVDAQGALVPGGFKS